MFASPKAKTIASCLTTDVIELAATIEVPNLPKIAIPAAVPPAHKSSFIIVGAEYLKKSFFKTGSKLLIYFHLIETK